KKSLEGKVAIVDIWGTWCPPCRLEIPHLVELSKKHASDPFVIVGLGDEDRKQNKDFDKEAKKEAAFAKENGMNYTLALIDTPTLKQVPKFSGYPTTLFIDKTGKVRLVEIGYKPLDYLDGVVAALLKEGAAPRASEAGAKAKTSGY
ncbi:MAG TPA: TlpA disulfide reductase family protein, partial [Planctomycetota bacterium]|nr:TlpA disulfide reductase family protein [Planctomycetota bacterium]